VLENNPGVAAIQLLLEYDNSRLQLLSNYQIGNILTTLTRSENLSAVPLLLNFESTYLSDATDSGTLITLQFQVLPGAATAVPITVTISHAFNSTLEAVDFIAVNGVVDIEPFVMLGDINGDGFRNQADVFLLRRYIAGHNVPVNEGMPLVPGSVNLAVANLAPPFDAITLADVVILRQFLAGWDVTLGPADSAMETHILSADNSGVKISVSSDDAAVGEYIDIAVSLDENPGLALLHLMLDYDASILEPVGFTAGLSSHLIFTPPALTANPLPLMFEPVEFANVTATGTLVIIRFRVLDTASAGLNILELGSKVIMDADMTEIFTPTIVNGSVDIAKAIETDKVADPAEIAAEGVFAEVGNPEFTGITQD
jgi:hypothetical protein